MEILLHYTWQYKMLPLGDLHATDGREISILDPGLHNRNAGPDFFNAKIKIGDTLWVGNVEIHDRSRDWYSHGHDKDSRYDNVILHVATVVDMDVVNSKGVSIPQVSIDVPQYIKDNYKELIETADYPPCYRIVSQLSSLLVHSWMTSLEVERLEAKTIATRQRAEQLGGDWESAYFVTLARNFGFGINGDTFERWAMNVPLRHISHHRDDLFQIEAFFMGQAGLLEMESIPAAYQKEALSDGYFLRLRDEYSFLRNKFSLTPIEHRLWKFLRLRPQNFPHIRISQLAFLYYSQKSSISKLTECHTTDDIKSMLSTHVTPYWETHYTFGAESGRSTKNLSPSSLDLLMINTAIPTMFAYGIYLGNQELKDRAFSLLQELKPENNYIVRMWQQCGLSVETAGDSQALIQLKKEYCDKRDCLRCRFGYEYLKGRRK